jgi:hypothetical protein
VKTVEISIAVSALVALGFSLFMNIYEPLEYLNNPLYGQGLGNLCDNEDSCKAFCDTSRGRCENYCQENPSNEICENLFGDEI